MKNKSLLLFVLFPFFSVTTAYAAPFHLQFNSTATTVSGFPASVTGGEFHVDLVVDNGGLTHLSQSWNAHDIKSISIRVGSDYSSGVVHSSSFSHMVVSGTIASDSLGDISASPNWIIEISGNTDSNSVLIDAIRLDGIATSLDLHDNTDIGHADLISDDSKWQLLPPESYNGYTTGSPKFARPFANCTVGSSSHIDYHVFPFSVDKDSNYSLHAHFTSSGFDGFLLLYKDNFDPANPLVNCIAGNDDDGNHANARITASLLASKTYYLVTSGFNPNDHGSFSLNLAGSANISLGAAIPSPGECDGNNTVNVQDVICTIGKILTP